MSDQSFHNDVSVYAGDDWVINGTLKNEMGGPFDLNDADLIIWALLAADGRPSPASDSAVIAVIEPATDGKITISVPDTMTTGLAPGHYTDALRVHDGEGKRSTLWSGHILVSADLFA